MELEQPIKQDKLKTLAHLDEMLCPENLSIEELLNGCPADVRDKWKKERRLKGLYGVVNQIIYINETYGKPRGFYVNINNRDLKVICGREFKDQSLYVDAVHLLVSLGVIRVNSKCVPGVFSRSYALTRQYWGCDGLRIVSFRKRKERADKVRKPDTSEIRDSVMQYISNCMKGLCIAEDKLKEVLADKELTDSRKKRIKAGAQRIRGKISNLRAGRIQKRLYHSITSAPRQLRQALEWNGERMAEVDVKQCHPVLILTLCDGVPAEELERYNSVLEGDIYSLSSSPRELAKKEALRFFNGKYKRRNDFGEAFKREFPAIANKIRGFEGSVGRYLQNLEAEICIYGVIDKLRALGIVAISIHDAFLVPESRAEETAKVIKESFLEAIGFNVRVTFK